MNTFKVKDTNGLFHIVFIDKIVEIKELTSGLCVIVTVSDRIVINNDIQSTFDLILQNKDM